MRDAFGGAFMIKLFLVFIIVYVFFTAIALNYAKAFKVKNKVIEYLEENEVTDIRTMQAAAFDAMNEYFEREILRGLNYNGSKCPQTYDYCQNGIAIQKISGASGNKLGDYYKVTTYFGWDISFFRVIRSVNGNNPGANDNIFGYWAISGETRPIVGE